MDVGEKCEIYLSIAQLDLSPIISRLEKQQEKLQKEVDKLLGMLNNEKFVANAPQNVLEQNRVALKEAQTKLDKVKVELQGIKV